MAGPVGRRWFTGTCSRELSSKFPSGHETIETQKKGRFAGPLETGTGKHGGPRDASDKATRSLSGQKGGRRRKRRRKENRRSGFGRGPRNTSRKGFPRTTRLSRRFFRTPKGRLGAG